MDKEKMKSIIKISFKDVSLEDGVSILQTQVIDKYGEGLTDEEFDAIKNEEVTDNWLEVSASDLHKCQVAYLDGKGFRYYIPALMLNTLDGNNEATSCLLSTLCLLRPNIERKDFWDYDTARYKILNQSQRKAVAQYLYHLHEIISLDLSDKEMITEAIRNYWKEYLDTQA